MKLGTGIVRRIDNLGRIVLPKEMIKCLDIEGRDPVEISIEKGAFVIKKYQNRCVFCGKLKSEYDFEEKKLCKNCLEKIKNKF